MSKSYEIEIKSLLGSKENADTLRQKIVAKGGKLKSEIHDKQLNHYFTYTDLSKFHSDILSYLPNDKKEIFSEIITRGKNFSIRTRESNGKVLLVIKASLDDHTSDNGVSRMEFESETNMSLEDLDKVLLAAGLQYQAKWSREREEYQLEDTNITIDKNAGYGYLAEFEKVIENEEEAAAAKSNLLVLMADFGVGELSQERIERMFAFYNSHWPEYYGTDKVFTIK
ncbi:MAG TPA: CYTH domain-containing protein [Candidatus Paceibacterota bacterium]|nr:CYTH domain-containing protein [Candidatus Paceibacterota bacterium]